MHESFQRPMINVAFVAIEIPDLKVMHDYPFKL